MVNIFEDKQIYKQHAEGRLKLLIEIINNEKFMESHQNSSNYAKLRNIHI